MITLLFLNNKTKDIFAVNRCVSMMSGQIRQCAHPYQNLFKSIGSLAVPLSIFSTLLSIIDKVLFDTSKGATKTVALKRLSHLHIR